MAIATGAPSRRTTLPEYYLQKWGDAIEVEDYAAYAAFGLGHYVCFLSGPSHEHSNARAAAADSDLAHYSPKNGIKVAAVAHTKRKSGFWLRGA